MQLSGSAKPITILYVHHGKGIGGAPLSLLYLIKALDRNKYRPIVAFLYDSEVIELFRAASIEIIGPLHVHDFAHTKIWWYRWYHPHHMLKALWSQWKTIRWVAPVLFNRIKPDIIHLNTSSLVGWAVAAHRHDIPVVWHIREPLAHGYLGIRRWLVRWWVGRYASCIVPICKHDAKPWSGDTRVSVVYNPVDITRFKPQITVNIQQNGRPTILFLGGMSYEKGTLFILQVLDRLCRSLPQVQLCIAGYLQQPTTSMYSPRYYLSNARYQRMVWSYIISKLQEHVVLLGPVRDVPVIMAPCNVVVFPAMVGHFARPVIEAGCMGKSVVASNIEPLNEIVLHGQTGLLLERGNVEVWAEQLHQLLTDTERQQRMGAQAAEWCTPRFSSAIAASNMDKLYQKALKPRRA